MARKRPPSRTQRWQDAARKAVAAKADLEAALEELKEVQGEYEEWESNISDKFSGTAVHDKLQAITALDLEIDLSVIEEAEAADLPLGFGRD